MNHHVFAIDPVRPRPCGRWKRLQRAPTIAILLWLGVTSVSLGFPGLSPRWLRETLASGFLWFPGFLAQGLLFPKEDSLDATARYVLAFVLSAVACIWAGLLPALLGRPISAATVTVIIVVSTASLALADRILAPSRGRAGIAAFIAVVGTCVALAPVYTLVNNYVTHSVDANPQAYLLGPDGTWDTLPHEYARGSVLKFDVGVQSGSPRATPITVSVSGIGAPLTIHRTTGASGVAQIPISIPTRGLWPNSITLVVKVASGAPGIEQTIGRLRLVVGADTPK